MTATLATLSTGVEPLSATRVRLTVDVPFSYLREPLAAAYRDAAKQVMVPGFRPGHAPPRLIDRRVGRKTVIQQALRQVLPDLYRAAVKDAGLRVLGDPDLDVTTVVDEAHVVFTADVDVRPEITLPDFSGLEVTVDTAEVTGGEVDEFLAEMRERFAWLEPVHRPASASDYVTLSMSASAGGELVSDAQVTQVSYMVGAGTLFASLDTALTGLSAGDVTMVRDKLLGGSHAGREADIKVTVGRVAVKVLPELGDKFAADASEHDTLTAWRETITRDLAAAKRARQAEQASQRAVDAVLAVTDFPLPESAVTTAVEQRERLLRRQPGTGGVSSDIAGARLPGAADLGGEVMAEAEKSVRTGLLLDQVAEVAGLTTDGEEVAAFVSAKATEAGVDPGDFLSEVTAYHQEAAFAVEVLRGKALAWLASQVTVHDTAGVPVDVTALREAQ
jgi:trigger factor